MALLALVCALATLGCDGDTTPIQPEQSWTVASPDGQLEATLRLTPTGDSVAGKLTLEVHRDGFAVLEPSPLGIETQSSSFVDGLTFVGAADATIDESYATPVGKSRSRTVRANEGSLTFESADGARFVLELRAQDDGVAYRYRLLGDGEVAIAREASAFSIPAGSAGYMAPYDVGGILFFGAYEQLPRAVVAGEPTSASGWAYPALFEIDGGNHWLMITEAGLDASYCGTRLGPEPDGSRYSVVFPQTQEGLGEGDTHPIAALPLQTPWRTMIIGDLPTVVGSTLVDDLAAPSELADTAWIEPGRVAWSWYSQDTGDPALQAEYLGFAREMGWEYVLIDAGWDVWPDPEAATRDLVARGAPDGVRFLLWYNSAGEHSDHPTATPLDRMLDPEVRRAEMAAIADWGVAGIKVDFFESDKQDRIEQYIGILEDAAAAGLLVNFHGATLPRGWQRTWPHLMTTEAVRGGELYRFDPAPPPTADTHLLYTFGRNVVGSMDYTPVIFADAFDANGQPYAHSLALAVLFESGLQHFADRADGDTSTGYRQVFADYPFVRDFMSEVPTVWDETILLDGHPDSHVVLARRHDERWYVAAITAVDSALNVAVPTDFLSGNYELDVIRSGATPNSLLQEVDTIGPNDSLAIELSAGDGLVATLKPQP